MITTIRTRSGKVVDPFDVKESDIDINDIAHSLSMQCRYIGHTIGLLSVARHSLWVADRLHDEPIETRVWGLLHDAAEAYLGDLASPIKHRPEMRRFRQAETAIELVLGAVFKLPWPIPPAVHDADQATMEHEVTHERHWYRGLAQDDEEDFLEEFYRLQDKRA